ncbi:unnamed protein product, partial [Rotaria sp. Silwood1]
YGDSIGTLNVYLFDGSYTRIWSLSGNRGNQWYEGQVSYVSMVPHQLIVEAIAGNDSLGTIAIDDFTFTTSNCSIRPIDTTVSTIGTTLPSTLLTTTTRYTDPLTTTTSSTDSLTTSYIDPLTATTRVSATESIGIVTTIIDTARTTEATSSGMLTTTSSIAQITTTTYTECAQYACFNDGICKPSSTQVRKQICECKPGFHGPLCENKETSLINNNLGAILGGVFGGLTAIALVIVGYIYLSSKKRAARIAATSAQLTNSLPNGSTKNPAYNETPITDA